MLLRRSAVFAALITVVVLNFLLLQQIMLSFNKRSISCEEKFSPASGKQSDSMQRNETKRRPAISKKVFSSTKVVMSTLKRTERTTGSTTHFTTSTISPTTKGRCIALNDRLHPLCEEKFVELRKNWKKTCYKDFHKIDGSNCSILSYLQEVEPFCSKDTNNVDSDSEKPKAEVSTDLDGFLHKLKHKDFDWVRQRAKFLWPDWVDAAKNLKEDETFSNVKRKKILFYSGALSYMRWILLNAGKGSFLGELVQWTDTMASTYILGHDITVILDKENVTQGLLQKDEKGCAAKHSKDYPEFDLIFSDIIGMQVLTGNIIGEATLARYRCKLRLLDSFGTEAEYNYKDYHEKPVGGKSGWGSLNLLLPQFYTYFPHSPDNTFLGFICGKGKLKEKIKKKDQAVIYGKQASYLKGKTRYLDIIKDYFEIHGTLAGNDPVPSYVKNHGVLSYKNLTELLKESKVFIGLGFPFEGPAPLEAISFGTVFINPKFLVPKSKLNEGFFGGKPNKRKITSQNQYMEDFVEEIYSHTVSVENEKELRSVLETIKKQKEFRPHLPKEFTNFGMLERMHSLIEHQDFCDKNAPRWPPVENLHKFLAAPGVSCKDECHRREMICEWTFFHDINNLEIFKRFGKRCKEALKIRSLDAPFYNPVNRTCYIQDHSMYFSCVSEKQHIRRVCPCRTFIPKQTALCEGC